MAEDTTTLRQEDTLRPDPLPRGLVFGALGPPIVWAVHFLVIYGINAVSCWASPPWTVLGIAGPLVVIGLISLASLALIGWAAWFAYHAWRRERRAVERGDSWRGFMGLLGLLLAGLLGLAVVLETVPMFVLAPCA